MKHDGLVIQQRGWGVRGHAPAEILEVIAARAGVESEAAYVAAHRLDQTAPDRQHWIGCAGSATGPDGI